MREPMTPDMREAHLQAAEQSERACEKDAHDGEVMSALIELREAVRHLIAIERGRQS